MPLSPGTRLGPYEVIVSLGAGGMGEVYRARDTKLNRDVALKILPESFANDADRLTRFRREAQVLASLNHPNIAQIYGFEDSGATHALVMELVDGQTLADHIAHGPIPLSTTLPLASQITLALEAAHELGIVHRDLKPANVKVRSDGTVKVLDFGLAKAVAPEGATATADAMNSPTMTSPATQMGLILGTAAYMSPEQAKGRAVDRRADIWAFGVVLYEMLTGRRLFEAEDVSETLAAVLTRDVGVKTLPSEIPAALRALLRDCLVRDPKQRLRDIGDARIVIDRMIAGAPDEIATAQAAVPAQASGRWRAFVWPAVALVLLGTVAWLGSRQSGQPARVADIVRFDVSAPAGVTIRTHRLSPDGHSLAIGATQGGKGLIFIHTFETGTAQALSSTDGVGPGLFAWAPDSKAFVFLASAEGKLRRASAQGGPSQVIGNIPAGTVSGGSWGSRDVILLGASNTGPILRVAATGGEIAPATELDASKKEVSHRHPRFLPDGRHFFFLALGPEDRQAYVGSLDSKDRRPLPDIASDVAYSSGRVLFLRDGALMSQPFDPDRLELSGVPSLVVDAMVPAYATSAPFSVSENGTLSYRVAATRQLSQLFWFDRNGKQLEAAGPVGDYGDIELSLDERYVAFESGVPGNIWALDLANGVTQRVTSDGGRDADPVWSPDGKTIAFRAARDGGRLYSRAFGVVGEDKPMLESTTRDSPASWSRDGKYLAFEADGAIFALPMSGDTKPVRVTESTPGISRSSSQISPDGRWVAYHSSELGQRDVYIQSFPQPGARQRVSVGGNMPRWSHDGSELFYLSDGAVMSVRVKTLGGTLNVGAPVSLFKLNMVVSGGEAEYAVSSTGRFLVNVPSAQVGETPINVILNWAGGAKK